MATLPIYLGENEVAIYGMGSTDPVQGLTTPPQHYWGSIYQVGEISWPFPQVGDNVLFGEQGIVCRLAYVGTTKTGTYTILKQSAIIATQEIVDVP